MKENPLISVIVPVYNVEKYLDRCVESIVNQTYLNLEIVLVDDGSPDKCPLMCDCWAEKDHRIKVIHKQNGGLSDARNAGMAVAKGKCITFIDSDDWIETDAFDIMLNRMVKDDSDVVSCGVKWVSEDDRLLYEVSVAEDEIVDNLTAMREIISDGKLRQHVWNKLYKRELIADIPFEKGKYHEDVFWSYQVFGRAKKVTLMKDSFYHYVQRSNSIMGERYSVKRLDALDAMLQRCEYIKHNYPYLFNMALYSYIGGCMYHLQCALRSQQDSSVRNNIISRIEYSKNGDPTEGLDRKNRLWIKSFLRFPVFTSKIRNLLKIGL